jgi:hypothetical protein
MRVKRRRKSRLRQVAAWNRFGLALERVRLLEDSQLRACAISAVSEFRGRTTGKHLTGTGIS